jgi:hypothetical protein
MLNGVPVRRGRGDVSGDWLTAGAVQSAFALRRAGVRSCRIVTRAGNARSFPLRSQDITIMAVAEAYDCFRVGEYRGGRHASLYPPLRRRTILHDLSKL